MAVRDGIAGQIQEEIGQITWDPQKEFGTITALREALQSLPESERQIVLMNRAAVPIEEIEESLKNLKDYNSEVSLLILIPEGSGSGDRGYNIVKIANRLGIIKVSVKTIKP